MAKRARVKGKGADIFFSEPEPEEEEETPASEQQEPPDQDLMRENQRLRTEVSVLKARIELLEQDLEPLKLENSEMRQRLETYAEAFAKMLFSTVTSGEDITKILSSLAQK